MARAGGGLTDAGLQELAADPLVHADGFGHLLHVGPGGLAQGADAVDAADPLGQEGIGRLRPESCKVTYYIPPPPRCEV